jgi:hypothetical protein
LELGNNDFPSQDLSFLTGAINLETLFLANSRFIGSLDYLSNMKQLKRLYIGGTDISEVNLDKLPESLEEIDYSIGGRPNNKLTEIISQLEKYRYGRCNQCQHPNTNKK